MSKQNTITFREIWRDYHAEVVFGLILAALVVTSTWLSQFIPDDVFDHATTPALVTCTATVALFGASIIFRRAGNMRMHRLWGYALVLWGLGDLFYLISYLVAPMRVMNMGAEHLTTYELLIGNLLGWVMTLYPTETLRPGWLTPKVVFWQLLPLFVLVALDYMLDISLWPLVALYPYLLLILVLSHIRAYRIWCENNFSSMDNIDVQWIIRYCIMLFIVGANYVYMCTAHDHARGFTQQWFVIFMLAYSTEQILFRRDPWTDSSDSEQAAGKALPAAEAASAEPTLTTDDAALAETVLTEENIRTLEQWMSTQKPYLDPELKLIDLREILPLNRTYLSQLVNKTYGCTFYQFVNRYRIEEAKQLMQQHPEMKLNKVAELSGFSSYAVFAHIFTRDTGFKPAEWVVIHSQPA